MAALGELAVSGNAGRDAVNIVNMLNRNNVGPDFIIAIRKEEELFSK